MKKIIIGFFFSLQCCLLSAQNVGIGTASPNASAQLDISSTTKGLLIPRVTTSQRTAITSPANGLMVYDTDLSAFWFYNGSSWSAVSSGGASQWVTNGNNIYNSNTGNVGIGISNPVTKLHIHSPNNSFDAYMRLTNQSSGTTLADGAYIGLEGNQLALGNQEGTIGFYTGSPQTSKVHISAGGFVGIGTASPQYKLQVNDGSIALYNSTDLKYWNMQYNSGSNYFSFQEDGTSRLTILPGGNVGIGTISPAAKLDVVGNLNVSSGANIETNLTVNGGSGIMRNTAGSAQLKYYTREVPFTAILAGHALSAEGSFGFASAGFTTTPAVMVGDIVSTGGTVGQLYRVQLIIYGCNTTSCKARLLNTSPNSVNYDITWNIIAIGN